MSPFKHVQRRHLLAVCAVFAVLAAGAVHYRERIAVIANGSARASYEAGMHHLNSLDATRYDIDEAEYFFARAAAIDSRYPYVQHQIARIHFLKGRYPEALEAINKEIANDPTARGPVFYVRGLIEGYLGDYTAAVEDYKRVVELTPERWEGRVDYAWVLIQTRDFTTAMRVVEDGLRATPDNPWLLSMRAAILHEQGNNEEALVAARAAQAAVETIDEQMWLAAYPGNAPRDAATGIRTLRESAQKNLELIEAAAHGR